MEITYKVIAVSKDNKIIQEEILSYDSLATLIGSMPDDHSLEKFYELAATHPASTVRENVSYKDNLSKATVNTLANDSSVNVLRNLTRSQSFRENATEEMLTRMMAIDPEVAQSIAGYIDSYEDCNTSKIVELLLALADPCVAGALANNYNSPKNILKKLSQHPDPYISNQAKKNIN